MSDAFLVAPWVLIIASLTVITSVVFYIWIPKQGNATAALSVYLLLGLSVSGLIATTGMLDSPFVALWMFPALFAGIFGAWGLVPALVVLATVLAYAYLQANLTVELIVVLLFAGVLPLIASFILWRHQNGQFGGTDDREAYQNLASELSEVATKSEVVINAIGDGVMAIDVQGVIQLINPAAQTILGWSKQDAMGLNYKSVLQLIDNANAIIPDPENPVQQALNTNQQIRNNDMTGQSKSGKKLMLSMVVSPIGETGSGAIVVFRDVTKEKAEEREQAEFISTASHEMRTPVASIEGFLGLALNPQTAQIDDRARGFIMKAHEAAQHLGRLFQDLLDISRADDRRLTNNPKVLDLVQFTGDLVTGFTQKASDKGLRIRFKPIPEDGGKHVAPVYYINLDNDHVRELLDNLIENAIKYTLAGEVVVDIQGTDDRVTVSIKDSGIGIPSEDIPHLFQKFYRVNNEETNQIGGTGLGLYLCRKLAEAMDGRIWVESEYKKGSTFYVEFPRISAQEASQLSQQQAMRAAAMSEQTMATVESTPVVNPAAAPPVAQPAAPTPVPQPAQQSAVPAPTPTAPRPTPAGPLTTDAVKPATTVPRGETLSREQIAAQVKRLEELAKQTGAGGQA